MDSIIQTVLDGKFAELQSHLEKEAARKTMQRVAEKKVEILANINGVSVEKMQEVLNIKDDKKKQ